MSDPEKNLKKRIKALETNNLEIVDRSNDLEIRLSVAFGKIKADKNKMQERLTAIENMLLMGDFKTKLAKGQMLKRV